MRPNKLSYANTPAQDYAIVALCFAAFMITHGLNLTTAGYNIDDWGHVASGSDWGVLGRWGLEVFYQHALGTSFSITFQLLISFLSMMGISLLLSRSFLVNWSRPTQNVAAGCTFLVGSTHPYWLDSHNFSTAIAAYPFTALLGLAAFSIIIAAENRGRVLTVISVLGSAVLLGAALSIYQPAALFGVLVPGLVLVNVRAYPFQRLFKIGLLSGGTLILGLLVYRWQAELYFLINADKTPNSLLEIATPGIFLDKLGRLLPEYTYALAAGQFALWTPVYFLIALLFLALFVVLSARNILKPRNRIDLLAAIRLSLGVFAAATLPIAGGWLVIEPNYPLRSLSLIAFPIVFLSFFVLHEGSGRRAILLRILVTSTIVLSLCGIMVSSIGWSKQQRSYERDLAVAYAVGGALTRNPPADEILIAGNRSYPDLAPVGTIGQSIFENYWGTMFIFKELFNLDVRPVDRSPAACDAIPYPGSVVMDGSRVYVCLQKFD